MDDAVRVSKTFAHPPETLYRAWTDPAMYARWSWGSLGKNTNATVDCRPGGRYRVTTECGDGVTMAFSGSYVECVPAQRLVYTVEWEPEMVYGAPVEQVTVSFHEVDGGTKVDFVHTGVPPEGRPEHERGWANTLDTLAACLDPD